MTDNLKIEIAVRPKTWADASSTLGTRPTRRDRSFAPRPHLRELGSFVATLSPARIALLKRLAADGPAPSITALADALARPYRRVHDDVAALHAAGLVEKRQNDRARRSKLSAHLDLNAA